MICWKRCIAFVIDWNLCFIISFPFIFLGPNFDIEYIRRPSMAMFSSYGVILCVLSFIFLPLIKDLIFRNASIGKIIMGLKIVDAKTGKKPKFSQLIIRNILFYLHPMDFLVLIIQNRSLSDCISGTNVISRR